MNVMSPLAKEAVLLETARKQSSAFLRRTAPGGAGRSSKTNTESMKGDRVCYFAHNVLGRNKRYRKLK